MKPSFRILSAAVLFAATFATAPLAAADEKPGVESAGAAPGAAAADPPDSRVPSPPAGKGEIVFFRPMGAGIALVPAIHEGDQDVGKVGASSYTIHVADPGDHTYTVKTESTDTLHMEVDAGETYYVKETIGMGLIVGRAHLTPSDAASFAKLKGLKLAHQPTAVQSSPPRSEAASGTN
jgi:hypothetical protein